MARFKGGWHILSCLSGKTQNKMSLTEQENVTYKSFNPNDTVVGYKKK